MTPVNVLAVWFNPSDSIPISSWDATGHLTPRSPFLMLSRLFRTIFTGPIILRVIQNAIMSMVTIQKAPITAIATIASRAAAFEVRTRLSLLFVCSSIRLSSALTVPAPEISIVLERKSAASSVFPASMSSNHFGRASLYRLYTSAKLFSAFFVLSLTFPDSYRPKLSSIMPNHLGLSSMIFFREDGSGTAKYCEMPNLSFHIAS